RGLGGILLPRHDGLSSADVYRRLGDRYRSAADLGSHRMAQAIGRRMAARPEWRAFNRLRRSSVCSARCGAVALVWMIGWFAVVFGCLSVALAFRLKKFKTTSATLP